MAKKIIGLTMANVLQQAAASMLPQANQTPQNILQLARQ
jgi:flagellin-like hook-associated protein FlgL